MNIKEQIRIEIEREKKSITNATGDRVEGRRFELNNLLSFLDTLPEQPAEGLEEEVNRYYSDNFDYISSDQPTLSILTNIARHFAEWGAKHTEK